MLAESSLPDLVKMALARPQLGCLHVLWAVEYARSHGLGYYAQKAMVIALGAVVGVDNGRGQAI